jgi:16S rRNA processing protein RimM
MMLGEDTPAWPDDAIEVGRIIDAWGIKGGFKVQAFSADPQALFSSRRWFLKRTDAGAPARAGACAAAAARPAEDHAGQGAGRVRGGHGAGGFRPQRGRGPQGRQRLRLAQQLSHGRSDEFYWVDLIGLNVENREGVLLGQVQDLIDTGPHCVLRVRRPDAAADAKPDEAERLIPFVSAYVDQVDLPGRRIVVDWGLDY